MGVARYEFRTTLLGQMAMEAVDSNFIKHEIKEIIGILPFQVEIVEQKDEPEGLHWKHTLYLKHPAFIDGSLIKDLRKWEREIGCGDDGKIYQFNKKLGTLNYDDFIRDRFDETID